MALNPRKNVIHGSAVLSKWYRAAIKGESGFDFAIIGDSNSGYGEPAAATNAAYGARKYGLVDALISKCILDGINQYASPIFMYNVPSNFGPGIGTRNTVGIGEISGTNLQNSNLSATVGTLGSAYTYASGDDFTYFQKELSSKITVDTGLGLADNRYHQEYGSAADWHYYSTTLNYTGTGVNYRTDALNIDEEPWLNEKPVAYYRVTHSCTTNGGSLAATVQANGGIVSVNPAAFGIGNSGGAVVSPFFKDSEVLLGRQASPHTDTATIRLGGFYSTLTAPIGIFFHSVYEKKVGVASSTLLFESGVLTESIRDKIKAVTTVSATSNGNLIGQMLAAIVRRQLAASSKNSGKVCIVIQGGTNQTLEGATADARANAVVGQFASIVDMVKRQWKIQGFPDGNLCFLIVSSPATNNSEMPLLSSRIAASGGSSNVTVFDHIAALPSSDYVTNSWWDGTGVAGESTATPSAHLTETGYLNWATVILDNVKNQFSKLLHSKK